MFLQIEELKSVLYEYQLNEIAENDDDIITDAIQAAISEARSYFQAANFRAITATVTAQQAAYRKIYDIDAIFSATGDNRNAFVLRLIKRIAAWNVCELSNVDAIYEHVRERYEKSIQTLEKIAGMGEYAASPLTLTELPSPPDTTDPDDNPPKPFRSGSHPKFHHGAEY